MLALAEEITGGRPQAPGMLVSYESALRQSAFSEVTNLSVEDERTWTKDSLVGWAFSTSFASQERLGRGRDEFERELRVSSAAALRRARARRRAPGTAPVNWPALADEKRARYELQHGEEDERSIVRRGNVAYAAGLALLMAHDDAAGAWFLRAAERWRASWDVGAGLDSWGRPVGAIKASLLARDDEAAERLRAAGRSAWVPKRPNRRSGATRRHSRSSCSHGGRMRGTWPSRCSARADFPPDVADALAFIAGNDPVAFVEAVEAVVQLVRDEGRLPRRRTGGRHRARPRTAGRPPRLRERAARIAYAAGAAPR